MGNHMRFNKPEVSYSEEERGKLNDTGDDDDDDGIFCSDVDTLYSARKQIKVSSDHVLNSFVFAW